jgi:hypothetical protein
MTPIHPEISVMKKIIQDLSLGYVLCFNGVTFLIFTKVRNIPDISSKASSLR